MQSQLETLSPVLVQVKVEVPWQKVNEDLETAYRAMQKKARIRGFRPGRVPRDVVKNVLGKSIRSEVTAELVRQGIGHAVEEHKLDPVSYQDLSPAAINDGEPLRFTAKLEVRPKIEQVDSAGLEVERVQAKVLDTAIDAEIDRLREQGAELITPEPARPSQADDTITFDVRVTIDGESKENMDASERRAELGKGNLLPELDAGLRGVNIGETKDISVSFPADYGYEELRGKTAVFHATVKNIQTKVLPDADDEFAKDLGEDTLDALRASVRGRMEKTAQERSDAEMREALVERLVDKNPVPVPPSLIEQEARSMLEQYVRIQYMLRQEPKLTDELQENFKSQAERKVRAGLLFGAIARDQNISVSPDDIEGKLAEIAERTGKHIAKVRAEHQDEQRRNLELQILEKKLLEYLVSRATIRDVEAKQDPSPETAQEATP